jgi:hypothetical protein
LIEFGLVSGLHVQLFFDSPLAGSLIAALSSGKAEYPSGVMVLLWLPPVVQELFALIGA